MGETPIEEMVEGCRRMFACFDDMGHELPDLNIENRLSEISAHRPSLEAKPAGVKHLLFVLLAIGPRSWSSSCCG